jgi:hypothetical protein
MNVFTVLPKITLIALALVGMGKPALALGDDNNNCLNFKELGAGAVYGEESGNQAGERFYREKGVQISLENFHYRNGDTYFGNLFVLEPGSDNAAGIDFGEGLLLMPSNVNLLLHFDQLSKPVKKVCFRFWDGGGEVNFAVNGRPVRVLDNLLALLLSNVLDIAPGVRLSIKREPNSNFPAGELCLEGDIKSLLIGGQEMIIGAICVATDDDNDEDDDDKCNIKAARTRLLACDEQGRFTVLLDLDYRVADNRGFEVFADGVSYGRFHYRQLPLSIPNIEIFTDALQFELRVCPAGRDNDDSDDNDDDDDSDDDDTCCVSVMVDKNCPPAICRIGEIEATNIVCNDATYNVTLNFRHQGASEKFFLKTASGFSGEFRYADLPITLRGVPLTVGGVDLIQVCDALGLNTAACCARVEIKTDCYAECLLGPVRVGRLSCNDDGTYNATIDFRRQNTGEWFLLKTSGGFSGRFRYADLPLSLEGLPVPAITPTPQPQDIIQICDGERPECCARGVVDLPCPPQRCAIGELQAYDQSCNNDGAYNVTINFRHRGGGEFFLVKTAGGFTGRFRYADLPLTLRGLPRPGDDDDDDDAFEDLIQVCDANSADCCARVALKVRCPDDGRCRIGDLRVSPTPCDAQGRYLLSINFRHANTSGSFSLIIDNERVGVYRYSDLPLRLGPFDGPLTRPLGIVVQDQRHPNCLARVTLSPFECEPPTCRIQRVLVSDIRCASDSTYNATLNVRHAGTSESFVLKTSGGFTGEFKYADLPLRLIDLPKPLVGGVFVDQDVFGVCDAQSGDCCLRVEVFLPCRPPCPIAGDLSLEPLACEGDSFRVKLNFRVASLAGAFTLLVDGQPYGRFAYRELPLEVGPFPGQGQTIGFEVIDEASGCRRAARLVALNCDGSCQFVNLRANAICRGDGRFMVQLRFLANNPGSSGYFIFANGRIQGPYRYNQPPPVLGPFAADGRTVYNFLLLDALDPTCHGYVEIGPIACPVPAVCPLDALRVRADGCTPQGAYRVIIDTEFPRPLGGGAIDIAYQGQRIGTYRLAALPLRLALRPGGDDDDADRRRVLTICWSERPDCCVRLSFEAPQCDDDDDDEDHDVWPGDANTDNVANHLDLLNIGIAFGASGPARENRGIEWRGIPTADWDQFFADGVNYKHADTNGDGMIDANDAEAIVRNYGRTHGQPRAVAPLPGADFDPPVFVEFPESGELPSGAAFEAPVHLGSEDAPVFDIYGLAFTVQFDPELFVPESIEVVFPTTWFGQPGVNAIALYRSFASEGFIEIALSRTDQNQVSGHGPICMIRGIIDDIAGIKGKVSIGDMVAIDLHKNHIPLSGLVSEVEIPMLGENPSPGFIDARRGLRLFPNPTDGTVRILSRHQLAVEWAEVLDAQGQMLGQRRFNVTEIALDDLPEGVYILRLKLGEHIVHEKVIKF